MITINTSWLLEALEEHDLGVHHYLNAQTGDIHRANEMLDCLQGKYNRYQ